VELGTLDYQIAHGPSKFLNPDKYQKMKLQEKHSTPDMFVQSVFHQHFELFIDHVALL